MSDPQQNQKIDHNTITDSEIQQTEAGQNAASLQNASGNTIYQTTNYYNALIPQKQKEWSNHQLEVLEQGRRDVQKRLADVLNNHELIPLAMVEQLDLVDRAPLKPRRKLETRLGETSLSRNQPIIEVFCRSDVQGKLLILGEPGAGKTTTLLTLADELLGEAIATPGTALPIIFELSAWKNDGQTIWEWLKAQLKEMYYIQPKESQVWLEQKLLLPLLDGLDELGMNRQVTCIRAINQFVEQFAYPQVVVCCRLENYQQGRTSQGATLTQLEGAVILEPLGDEQIQQYLQNVGRSDLWRELKTSAEMGAMLEPDREGKPGFLRSPLLLTIAAVAYEGKPFANRTELFEAYIDRRLSLEQRRADRKQKELKQRKWAYKNPEREPDWRDTRHYLKWLATKLKQDSLTEFLVERLQPSWLNTPQQKRNYQLIYGLAYGLAIGAISGLSSGFLGSPVSGLISGLFCGLVFGISAGWIYGLNSIYPVESFQGFMLTKTRKEVFKSLKSSLTLWLQSSLIMSVPCLLAVLVTILIPGLIPGLPPFKLVVVVIATLIMMLVSILIGGLINGVISGIEQDLRTRSKPNQGIWNSFQNTFLAAIFSYLPGVILAINFPLLIFAIRKILELSILEGVELIPRYMIAGIFGGLFLGFSYGGGRPFVQHFCLRYVLACNHLAPWDYVSFLNYCCERRLLQPVGGRYRFLHKELLDHFAQDGEVGSQHL